MSDSTIWWLLAGGVIAAELLTGTFYLLMFSLGLAAAALAAHAGANSTLQLVAAAVVGCGLVLAWHIYKKRQPGTLSAQANSDVNLDIGAVVQIQAWTEARTSSVHYRGAQWQAELLANDPAQAGAHRIVEIRGNTLMVQKV
jgi:membrane protein implicated in regulation of membrane protease activity